MAVYWATRAAMHSFTRSLRNQLRATTVSVFELAPPSVDSELGFQHRNDPKSSHDGMPVNELVRLTFAALEADELEAAIGRAGSDAATCRF